MGMQKQSGIAPIVIILIIIGVVAIVGVSVYYWQLKPTTQRSCMMEAQFCSDGSAQAVTPDCQYAPCSSN